MFGHGINPILFTKRKTRHQEHWLPPPPPLTPHIISFLSYSHLSSKWTWFVYYIIFIESRMLVSNKKPFFHYIGKGLMKCFSMFFQIAKEIKLFPINLTQTFFKTGTQQNSCAFTFSIVKLLFYRNFKLWQKFGNQLEIKSTMIKYCF